MDGISNNDVIYGRGIWGASVTAPKEQTLGSSVIAPKEQTVEDTLNGQIRELNRRIKELVEVKWNLSPAVLASPVSVIREAAKHL